MNPVNPAPLLQIATGYMAAKQLFVANELGIFEQLAAGALTLDDLAQRTGASIRPLRIIVDAMVALGILTKQAEGYQNAPVAAAFLSGTTPADFRPFLRLLDQVSYPRWLRLEDAVRGTASDLIGTIAFEQQLSAEQAQIFSNGVAALTAGTARSLVQNYDFSAHQRVLDLGGGTGSFLAAVLNQHPTLQATLFEIPTVAAVARTALASTQVADRIEVIEGNLFSDPIPGDHDVVILANVVHVFSPEHNLELLARVRASARPGTRLLLVDFWTDPTHTQPAFAALMAGEFLLVTDEGDVYSVDEVAAWLEQTGWRLVNHVQLGGPASLLVAE